MSAQSHEIYVFNDALILSRPKKWAGKKDLEKIKHFFNAKDLSYQVCLAADTRIIYIILAPFLIIMPSLCQACFSFKHTSLLATL